MTHVVVDGAGTVGVRACRQLLSVGIDAVTLLSDRRQRLESASAAFGEQVFTVPRDEFSLDDPGPDVDVIVCTRAASEQLPMVDDALRHGVDVVSTADDPNVVAELLQMDAAATRTGAALVIGATFSPGLSCLLAGFGASRFDVVDEIRVASLGSGGPACARRRLGAVVREAPTWKSEWTVQSGGSGRELVFFPDPVGPRDCYRGALAEPLLLVDAFPDIERVSARLAVPRVRHAFPWMPKLRAPAEDDGPGSLRVELRGRRNGVSDTVVLGAIDRASVASAALIAVVATELIDGGLTRRGAFGLAKVSHPGRLLRRLAHLGVKAAVFDPDAAAALDPVGGTPESS